MTGASSSLTLVQKGDFATDCDTDSKQNIPYIYCILRQRHHTLYDNAGIFPHYQVQFHKS